MRSKLLFLPVFLIGTALSSVFPAFTSGNAYADPPPWAYHRGGWHGRGHYYRGGPYYGGYYAPGYAPGMVVMQPPVIASYPQVDVACTPQQPILGTVIGGVAGGLIGDQFGRGNGRVASTIGGVLLGAMFGNQVDRAAYQQANDACAAQAFEYARPGTQVVWQSPDGSSAYSVLPVNTFQDQSGQYCREYQAQVQVAGGTQQSYGTACRQPDGTWRIVSSH